MTVMVYVLAFELRKAPLHLATIDVYQVITP